MTLDDKPLAGVFVRYYPVGEDEQLAPALGITNEIGRYTLNHDGDKLGTAAGKYRVVVSWPSRDLREAGRDGVPLPRPSAVIPPRYTVALKSPLNVDVKADGPQVIDLKLESDSQ